MLCGPCEVGTLKETVADMLLLVGAHGLGVV